MSTWARALHRWSGWRRAVMRGLAVVAAPWSRRGRDRQHSCPEQARRVPSPPNNVYVIEACCGLWGLASRSRVSHGSRLARSLCTVGCGALLGRQLSPLHRGPSVTPFGRPALLHPALIASDTHRRRAFGPRLRVPASPAGHVLRAVCALSGALLECQPFPLPRGPSVTPFGWSALLHPALIAPLAHR